MYLSVQLAARRLGVSPHTIRRWTASGFLPCTRTAGGHRRIKQEDIDELAGLIGDNNHLAARLARERELDTLVKTSIALSSQLDLGELFTQIAKQLTTVLDCHFCAISEWDEETRIMRVLADIDRSGNRLPSWKPYSLNEFPLAKRVMIDQEAAVVNINDPGADPAETAIMRRNGDRCLLLLPLVYQGRSVGLLEVLDHVRERRFSRQELRLSRALAGQAAVAMQNAKIFGRLRRSDRDVRLLTGALGRTADGLPSLFQAKDPSAVLQATAAVACSALGAISGVAGCGQQTAGATGDPETLAPAPRSAVTPLPPTERAHVLVARAACGGGELTLTVTLPVEPGDAASGVLRIIAQSAAQALAGLGCTCGA
jgi:excisionase family DNA binding protein